MSTPAAIILAAWVTVIVCWVSSKSAKPATDKPVITPAAVSRNCVVFELDGHLFYSIYLPDTLDHDGRVVHHTSCPCDWRSKCAAVAGGAK